MVLALLMLPTAGSAEPGPFPGLPLVEDAGPPFPPTLGIPGQDRNEVSWLNGPYNGLAGSTRSEQWLRLPTRALAINATFGTCTGPANAIPDNPCPYPVSEDTSFASLLQAVAFMVSPEGSEHPYGEGEIIPVHTVAFGSIPVVVEIQMNQVRDGDGLPVPLTTRLQERYTSAASGDRNNMDQATLTGDVRLRVVSLAVDGVDVGLRACETPPFALRLQSEPDSGPVAEELQWVDPDRTAYGTTGGSFSGTVDIPGLSGCRTSSGDDVSATLSSFLSGPDNPVTVRYGTMGCFAILDDGTPVFGPPPAGADTPEEAGCFVFENVPGDPRWNSIPVPREYPTYAPGDAAGQ
ncbi:hypothetical protein GCM10027215_05520 [Nocardioides zeae]